MSWMSRIVHSKVRSKPMALPFDYPSPSEMPGTDFARNPMGVEKMNRIITQDTADRMRRELNPSYRGSGSSGMAIGVGKGKEKGLIGKVTSDEMEARTARYLINHPNPRVIRVHRVSDDQKQHTDPMTSTRTEPIWTIMMDEADILTPDQMAIANDSENRGWRVLADEGFSPYVQNSYSEALSKYPESKEFIKELYTFAKEFKASGWSNYDIRGENVGFSNGRLVLIDLGDSKMEMSSQGSHK